MKNFKFLSYLLIAASSLVFMQCTSDYQAIPGQDGKDGIDGVDGIDGLDGVSAQVCIDCHNSSYRGEIQDAYDVSQHANGSSWARGTSGSCARCHNNQGYIDYLTGNFYELDTSGDPNPYLVDEGGIPLRDENNNLIANPDYNPNYGELPRDENNRIIYIQSANWEGYALTTPITCTGCHNPAAGHRSFDFENDGNDYALRNINPIDLYIDPSITIDMTNAVDPLGLSNTCINCHQPRNQYDVPVGTGDYTITSKRFGPHHGPQSTMLEGILGANIAGSTGYPGRASSPHRTGASCTTCHMGPTMEIDSRLVGGHTYNPTLSTCVECHDTMTEAQFLEISYKGVEKRGGIAAWSDYWVLEELLEAKGYIDSSGYVLGQDGINSASNSNPLVVPVAHAQAIWNYKTLEEDQSKGVHNPEYTEALLKNSIEALQN